MSDFYDSMAATADELIAEFGQACVLTSISDGAYNPETGEAGPVSTPYAVTAAILAYPQNFIDGSLIRSTDKRALMSPVGLTVIPKPGDTLTDAVGTLFHVVDAKETAPAGQVVLWTLQVRK